MTRAALIVLGVMSLGLACTEKGRSLVLVKVTNPDAVTVASVRAIVIDSSGVQHPATLDWNGTPSPFGVGVYLPKSVSGSVGVVACAFSGMNGAGAVVAAGMATQTIAVRSGESTDAGSVELKASMSSLALCADGGTGGRGGAGGSTGGMSGSGGGGVGGVSGSGGSIGGTGGIGGSVGGAAGTGGRGGNAGTGGAGGVAGTTGAGGRGGAGGVAGTTGTGGRGGAAGGAGGTGGAAATWRGALPLSNIVGNKILSNVAVDASGNAVVVYEQGLQVWSNRYDAITGWGTPGPVDTRTVGSRPVVAVDGNGNYLAVWGTDPNNAMRGIWYSTSSDGTEWSKPPVAFTTTVSYDPVVAMNANGMAIVAWTEQIMMYGWHQVGAVVRPGLAANWTAAKVLLPADDNGPRSPAVAVTGAGVALVGWEQDDGLDNGFISLWMQQYASGNWNAPAPFETYVGHNAYGISIATNSGNQAIATYTQITNSNPPKMQLLSRRLTNQSWATNVLPVFEGESFDAYVPPSVTIDDAGNATVAFAVETSTGFEVQTSRTAANANSWPAGPTSMETDNIAKDDGTNPTDGYVTMPIVKSDPAGNVTLIWRKRTTASGKRFDLVARRYTPAGGWGAQQFALEDNTTDSVFWPALAVGPNGTAVATWYFEPSREVWTNVFH